MKAFAGAGSSLRWRLILSLVLLFIFGAVATAVYQIDLSRRDWYDVGKQTMQAQAAALTDAIEQQPASPLAALSPDWRLVYAQPGGDFSYTIYDAYMRPQSSSPSLRGGVLPLDDVPDPGERFGEMRLVGPQSVPMLTVRLPGNGYAVVSRAGGWNEALIESIEHEQMETVMLFVTFAVMAVLLITIILRWTLLPVSRASAQAAAIGPGMFDQRIDEADLPIEIRPLAQGFNGALDRLSEAYAQQRRITANAAHELRTPLAVLSLRLQHARMGDAIDWPAIIEDFARMQRLLDQMLDLARKQASALGGGERGEVHLSRVVREAAALLLPLMEERGRTLDVTIDASVTLPHGRADDLRDMVRNLIENAMLHGTSDVSVTLTGDASHARLIVADEGPSPPEADALFEEFRKGRENSAGSGLGLAIVQQVAAAHGGLARFGPGPTTSIEVLLPYGAG